MDTFIEMKYVIIIVLSFCALGVFAQSENVFRARVIDGDTIPEITLVAYNVSAKRTWKSKTAYNRHLRLQKKVVKVYPFAHLAAQKLEQYAMQLDSVQSEREKKKFYKRIEAEIKMEYEGELRKLTVSEGRILIKLLDRETGNTSYTLVTELRGKFSAFFWQGLARIFGHDLKSSYDPYGADKEIEFIVRRIETGKIQI